MKVKNDQRSKFSNLSTVSYPDEALECLYRRLSEYLKIRIILSHRKSNRTAKNVFLKLFFCERFLFRSLKSRVSCLHKLYPCTFPVLEA